MRGKSLNWKTFFVAGFLVDVSLQLPVFATHDVLIFEWLASFMPYLFLLNLCIIGWFVIHTLLAAYKHKRNYWHYLKAQTARFKVISFKNYGLILASIFLLVITNSQLALLGDYYYSKNTVYSSEQTRDSKLRVAFFNKLYYNDNDALISQRLTELAPDVIGFAEFRKADAVGIKALSNYPYSYITQSPIRKNDTELALYSKFPLSDISEAINPDPPYLQASLKAGEQTLTLVVIHTAAPISPLYLAERNQQLDSLSAQLQKLNSQIDTQPLILMGDFNLTPWTTAYTKFTENLPWLTDLDQGRGPLITWQLNRLLGAEIDHMFVTTGVGVSNFVVDQQLGSDHHLIYGDFGL